MTKNNSHPTHKEVFLTIQKSSFAEQFLAVKGLYKNKKYYKIIIDNVIEYKSTEDQIEQIENDEDVENILKTSEYDAVLLIKSLQKYDNSIKARKADCEANGHPFRYCDYPPCIQRSIKGRKQ